jgi:hypothetical protein
MTDRLLPTYQLIEPSRIPGRTIDVGQIQDAARLLKDTAIAIRARGVQVETEWDALAGVYEAPEADDLFLIIKGDRGVGGLSRELAIACSTVAGALSALALAIDTTVKNLRILYEEAREFRTTVHDGLVDIAVPVSPTRDSTTIMAERVAWSEHFPTRQRNTDLIQAVNAEFVKLDEAQSEAVSAINGVDPSALDIWRTRYEPQSLDVLNSPGARLPYGQPRTPGTCSDENRGTTIGLWITDSINGVTTKGGYDFYAQEFSWATAGDSWAATGMTVAGLALFANPSGWVMQAAASQARNSPMGIPESVRPLTDFVDGAGDQAAGAVEGFTQWNTWATDPGKAATNVTLNVASLFTPVGPVTTPLKLVTSVKAGSLVERLATDIGTKVGGHTGDALAAGLKTTAGSTIGALKLLDTVLDAPTILTSELAKALKNHVPVFAPGEPAGGSSEAYGEYSPERRAEPLRQEAERSLDVHRSDLDSDSPAASAEKPDPVEPGREHADGGSDPGKGDSHGGPSGEEAHGGVDDGMEPGGAPSPAPFSHPSSRVTEAQGVVYLDGEPTMTVVDFQEILDSSSHNADAAEIMLGKYNNGAPDNYINRAKQGANSYFDLGLEWDVIAQRFTLDDRAMFQLFNVPFLDDAIRTNKTIHFSQDPVHDTRSLRDELRYLEERGYKYDEESMTAWRTTEE